MTQLIGVYPQLRGNLHTHSTRSDGHLSQDELLAWYRNAGYDFLAITDHQMALTGDASAWQTTITTASDIEGILLLSGGEFHPRQTRHGDRWHILAVGVYGQFDIDALDDDPPGLVTQLLGAGAWVAIAHPGGQGITAEDAESLGRVHAVEIYNERSRWWDDRTDGWYLADELASRGWEIGGVAVDDAHFDGRPDHGRGWVMVEAAEPSVSSVIAALKARRYYASQGPVIHALATTKDAVRVHCSEAEAIIAIGRGQVTRSHFGAGMTEAEFPLAPFRDGYLRMVVRDESGARAWSNPIHL